MLPQFFAVQENRKNSSPTISSVQFFPQLIDPALLLQQVENKIAFLRKFIDCIISGFIDGPLKNIVVGMGNGKYKDRTDYSYMSEKVFGYLENRSKEIKGEIHHSCTIIGESCDELLEFAKKIDTILELRSDETKKQFGEDKKLFFALSNKISVLIPYFTEILPALKTRMESKITALETAKQSLEQSIADCQHQQQRAGRTLDVGG